MSAGEVTAPASDWARSTEDVRARRWNDTDAALPNLSPHLYAARQAWPRAGAFKALAWIRGATAA